MSFGMEIYDAAEAVIFSSALPNVSFYYGANAPSTYPAGRIAFTHNVNGTRLGWTDYGIDNKLESTDYVDSAGAVNAPSMTAGIGTAYNGSVVSVTTSVASFGADAGTIPPFAMDIKDADGVSKLSYLMPFSAFLESGSVSVSTPSIGNNGVQSVFNATAGWSSEPSGNTITFSRALDNPPFIFLTGLSDESVRVALYKFIKNGDGKFTGAILACAFKDGNWQGSGYWPWRNAAASVTVSYVVVENDKPTSLPAHGVAVYDAAGSLIYTSEVFPLRLTYAANVARPRITGITSTHVGAGIYSTSLSLGSTASGTSWDTADGDFGILLNATQGATGIASGLYYYTGSNYQCFVSACGCFVGLSTSGTVVTPTVYYDVINTINAYAATYSYYSHASGIDTNPFPVIVGDFTGAY